MHVGRVRAAWNQQQELLKILGWPETGLLATLWEIRRLELFLTCFALDEFRRDRRDGYWRRRANRMLARILSERQVEQRQRKYDSLNTLVERW